MYAYNSLLCHIFAIGQYTGRIIDCVVYITARKQFEINDKNNNTTVGDEDKFWKLSTSTNNNFQKNITYTHPLELDQIMTPDKIATNTVDNSVHSYCSCNYSGSYGAMENDGILYLMNQIQTVM